MEIKRIEETSHAIITQDINPRGLKGRVCIYFPDRICAAPRLQFKICRACPRAAQFIRQNIVKSIFGKIKALAIMLMNTMGAGVNGGGGGRGSSGGSV